MRRITGILSFIGLGLWLAGCTQPAPVWTKEAAYTSQDFKQDEYICSRDALASGNNFEIAYGYSQRVPNMTVYETCMESKGWRIVSQQEIAAAKRMALVAGNRKVTCIDLDTLEKRTTTLAECRKHGGLY